MMNSENREHRDWTLLIFIIPIGIILIIIVGQLAVRLVPFWRISVGMNSNLEPNPESARPFALLEPILPQILTPMAWAESYLTPGAEIFFPPFLTFEPTGTPSPTAATPTDTNTSPAPTETPIPTSTSVTGTPPTNTPGDDPPNEGTPPPPPTTCTDPAANNNGGPLPCTYPPTTCTDPAANNNGGPLPCIYGVVSTMPASYGTPAPIPSQIEIGSLPNNSGPASSNIGHILDGTYIVVSLQVTVSLAPDNNYDLAFYEYNYQNNGYILFDHIIIGISNFSDGSQYYEVFNWGNGQPDLNSNVGDVAQSTGTENDNQAIPVSELYDPDGAGPAPQTGILVDVDTAPSTPPAGTYDFIVIISPLGGSGESAQVDAIQTVEVPIPPTP